MKHTLLYIATLFLLAACQQEELPQGAQALGYLSLSAVEVEASDVQLISTRASETDDLMVTLTPTNGDGKLTECPCSETISCQPGTYTLEIYNQAYKDKADAAQYYYKCTEPVVITEGKTETVEAKVSMINFGVRLQLPDEFEDWFEDYTFTVNGETLTNGATVYFDYSEGTKITYSLNVTNTDGDKNTDNNEYTAVTQGTIYVITYELETQSLKIS